MTESANDYELFHYGVKGMKWGVIRENLGGAASSTRGFIRDNPLGKTRQAASNVRAASSARRNEYRQAPSTKKSKAVNAAAAVTGAVVAGKIMKGAIRHTPIGRNFAARHPVAALGSTFAAAALGGAAGSMTVSEIRRHRANSTN